MYKITKTDLEYLEQIVGKEFVFAGDEVNPDYTHDEIYGMEDFPGCIVFPTSAEEISAIMKYASSNKIPVTVRGSVQVSAEVAYPSMAEFSWLQPG